MRNRRLMVFLAAVMAIGLACSAIAAQTAPKAKAAAKKFDQKAVLDQMWSAPDSTVVGSVNGVTVTKGELMRTMWNWNAPTQLQDLLSQKMIEQAAKKAGVSVSGSELQQKINDSLKRMNMGSVDELLNQFRITWYRFMSGSKVSALAEKTVQKSVQVPDSELAEYIKARHVLIQFPQEEKDQAKKEEIAKKKADEVYQKAKAGEDFAKLANEYSQDPGNTSPTGEKQGGDLGWFRRGRMVPEFEKAAFGLKPGEISEPVKSNYGYHIIKVEAIGKDASPAEKAEIKKMIMESKLPMEMNKWYTDLQKNTKFVNKLSPPEPPQPKPAMQPPPPPRPRTQPRVQPQEKPAQPSEKPAAPSADEKPEMPPPPPPPTE